MITGALTLLAVTLSVFFLILSSPLNITGKVLSTSSNSAVISLGSGVNQPKLELWLEEQKPVGSGLVEPARQVWAEEIAGESIVQLQNLNAGSRFKLYTWSVGQKFEILEFATFSVTEKLSVPEITYGTLDNTDSYLLGSIVDRTGFEMGSESRESAKVFLRPNEYGNWAADLASFKSITGEDFEYSKSDSVLKLEVYASGGVIARREFQLSEFAPMPDIVIANRSVNQIEALRTEPIKKVSAQTSPQPSSQSGQCALYRGETFACANPDGYWIGSAVDTEPGYNYKRCLTCLRGAGRDSTLFSAGDTAGNAISNEVTSAVNSDSCARYTYEEEQAACCSLNPGPQERSAYGCGQIMRTSTVSIQTLDRQTGIQTTNQLDTEDITITITPEQYAAIRELSPVGGDFGGTQLDTAPPGTIPEAPTTPKAAGPTQPLFPATPLAPAKPKITVTMNAAGDILSSEVSGQNAGSNVAAIASEITSNFAGYREYDVPLPPAFLGFFTNYGYSSIGTIALLNSCSRSSEVERMCELYREFLSREAQRLGGQAITTFQQARAFGQNYGQYYSSLDFAIDFHREVVKAAGYDGIGASKSPNNIGSHGCIDIWDNQNKRWAASKKVLLVDTARPNDFLDYRNWVRADSTIYPGFKGRWGFDMPQEVGGRRGGIFRWSRSDVCGQIDIEYKIGNTVVAQTTPQVRTPSLNMTRLPLAKAETQPASGRIDQRGYYTLKIPSSGVSLQSFYAQAGARLTVFVHETETTLAPFELAKLSLTRNSDFSEIPLQTGWNLIHIPLTRPVGMESIRSLIDEVELQGAIILHASKYNGDNVTPFVLREDGEHYGQNFEVEFRSGYAVYISSGPSSVFVAGNPPETAEAPRLVKGLNLIGFGRQELSSGNSSASAYLESSSAKFISRLDSGNYQTLLRDEIDFGTNFQLNSTLGYFVLVE